MKLSTLYRLPAAAERSGVPRQTLLSAIQRGELVPHLTGCGMQLLTLEQIKRWQADPKRRGVGRPRKAAT